MERYAPLCFVIAACLVGVAGIVAFDRSEELKARRAATFAPVVVVEPQTSTRYSSADLHSAFEALKTGLPLVRAGEGPSPQLTAAFFDSVFPTPHVGG